MTKVITKTAPIYFANPVRAAAEAIATGRLGYIDTPAQGNARPAKVIWCADNGCFSDKFDEAKWWAWLESHAEHADGCVFAVAPDVVGDAAATRERSLPWLPKIRALGYPVAYVAQDGWDEVEVPWDEFDALFIGGSTEFKLGPVAAQATAEAKAKGKWVHMGRVNSRKRMQYAASIGCDSADGTYLVFGPEKNLPKLLAWVQELEDEVKASLDELDRELDELLEQGDEAFALA